MRRKSTKPKWQKTIALERIKILFELAAKEFDKHPERAHRYVRFARKIGMRYNVTLPKELKRRICKHCHSYLVPDVNCRIRTKASQRAVVVECLKCGHVMRYPYRKEK